MHHAGRPKGFYQVLVRRLGTNGTGNVFVGRIPFQPPRPQFFLTIDDGREHPKAHSRINKGV